VPDPQPVLLETWRGVLAWGREECPGLPVVAGGRSMGGRMASLAAAEGSIDPAGLVFYAYPLHPPGREDRLRFEHLPRVRVPMLFVSGTRDSMARSDLLEDAVARLGAVASLVWLDGADHGYAVPRRSGFTREALLAHVARETAAWYERELAIR
jgi:predicted alpha/beta-hydrolase family hydrolase